MIINIPLSKNFNLKEFIYSSKAITNNIVEQNNVPFYVVNNIFYLTISILQPLRNQVGRITITSGYRCLRLNNIIKGSKTSQHLKGEAVDFYCSNLSKALNHLKRLIFDQLIIYDTFIHVSYSANNNRNQIIDKRTKQSKI